MHFCLFSLHHLCFGLETTTKTPIRSTVIVAFTIVVSLRFVVVNFEAVLWVRLIVDYLVLSVRVHKRVPALDVAVAIGYFVSLLRILVIAGREAELVALGPMEALDFKM